MLFIIDSFDNCINTSIGETKLTFWEKTSVCGPYNMVLLSALRLKAHLIIFSVAIKNHLKKFKAAFWKSSYAFAERNNFV